MMVGRPQAAVEMVVQRHLGQGAQQVEINTHESDHPARQPPRRCSGPKAMRQHLGHRPDAVGGVDQELGAAVLPQQLAAAAARHQHVARAVHAGEGDEPAAAAA